MFRNATTVVFISHRPGPCTQVDCGLMAGNMVNAAKRYNMEGNYVAGANIAGFEKVVEAMTAQGIV